MTKSLSAYIPGLPSIDDAKKDYTQVTSDHIPFLTTIPFSCEPNAVTILSWNVLEDEKKGSGFAENGKTSVNESLEQKKARFERIAKTIKVVAENNKPAFITLQEISGDITQDNTLLQYIVSQLPNHYSLCLDAEKQIIKHGDCITLYDNKQFTPLYDENVPHTTNREVNGQIHLFSSIANPNCKIRLCNTHHRFTENTKQHEKNIRAFLCDDTYTSKIQQTVQQNTLGIMVGDFNGTIAPLNHGNTKCNIVTSVAASFATKNDPAVIKAIQANMEVQRAWATDGAFYAMQLDSGRHNRYAIALRQARITPIHPLTGIPFTGQELQVKPLSELSEFEQYELSRMRMTIGIDNDLGNLQISATTTLFALNFALNQFNHSFGNQAELYPASNLQNEIGLAAVITDQWQHYFTLLKNFYPHFHLERKHDNLNNAVPFNVLSTDHAHRKQLCDAIFRIVKNPDLVRFADSITHMAQNKNVVNQDLANRFTLLLTALIDAKDNATNKIVLKHFTELSKHLQKRSYSIEEIIESQRKLELELYGKPPLNKKIHTLIGAIFGAILSAFFGTIMALLIAMHLDGLSAIPSFMFDSNQGANTILASVIGGTIANSFLSFFQAKKDHEDYALHTFKKNSELGDKVFDRQREIYQMLKKSS